MRCAILSRVQFRKQSSTAALFHFVGKLANRIGRNRSALGGRKRSAGVFKSQQECNALALPFLPQRKSFTNGIFLGLKTTTLYGASSEVLLVRGEFDIHRLQHRVKQRG